MKKNENLGIALVATSNVKLSPEEMSQVNGGIGCGCCICDPSSSASGAVKYTASTSGGGKVQLEANLAVQYKANMTMEAALSEQPSVSCKVH